MLYVFVAIILFALAFGIVNTMLMAVLERSREIGMLMAIGMNKRRVFLMILLETSFLVLSGVPFGLVFGALTNLYFGSVGIDLSVFAKAYESFGFGTTVFPKLMLRHYLQMLLLVAITAMLSSLFPARKALALNPSEAIRK
jgi:ABC-type antimicrobial peptide transport system permease subunit